MRCFVVAGFLLTSASRGPSAIAEPLVREATSRGPSALADILVNFGGPIHISGMAEASAVKFCTKGDISSLAKGITDHPKKERGYGHVSYLNS